MRERFHLQDLAKKVSLLSLVPYSFPAFLDSPFLKNLQNNPSPQVRHAVTDALIGAGIGVTVGGAASLLLINDGDDSPEASTIQFIFMVFPALGLGLAGMVIGGSIP